MVGQKSTLVRKKISERHIHFEHPKIIELNKIISQSSYTTNGEQFIVVKGIDNSTILLDGLTTEMVKVKALTNVLIKPKQGKIDEVYDEIIINNKACVEFRFLNDNWYITSSDGVKFD